ncbi:Fibrinogen C domain containing protein, partial [Asbolus verrucosus]
EQYLFDVFEAIISTLESKLQRIENLDKAVEHLMRRVEGLDTRVNSNIDKTESVIAKLAILDTKLFNFDNSKKDLGQNDNSNLGRRLVSLDQKVSDIDNKLNILKNQLDNNFLQGEDINAEASEKKPVSMNVVEITKALNTEVINHVTKELGQLREVTGNVDRKLQFHINLVSENLGKVLNMMTDVHHAIVDDRSSNYYNKTTTTPAPELKSNKIDALVQQIRPIISVSEKMDEVWDVVVGTKSSVDDLVPKSDELLTQTQRQERAIGEIHSDLRTKTNKIIANLDKVEKRLKKQEDDVATLAQRPVPAELLLDPTIDRLVEYDPSRYVDEYATDTTLPVTYTTLPPPTTATQTSITTQNQSSTTPMTSSTQQTTEKRAEKRKGGGYSCVDLLNAGMRDSGVYYLQIRGTTYWFLKVFCEQEVADGGW